MGLGLSLYPNMAVNACLITLMYVIKQIFVFALHLKFMHEKR